MSSVNGRSIKTITLQVLSWDSFATTAGQDKFDLPKTSYATVTAPSLCGIRMSNVNSENNDLTYGETRTVYHKRDGGIDWDTRVPDNHKEEAVTYSTTGATITTYVKRKKRN